VDYYSGLLSGEEVGDGDLGQADGVREVDVEDAVAGGGRVVCGGWRPWYIPEGGPWLQCVKLVYLDIGVRETYWFVYSCTRTHNVCASKVLNGHFEHLVHLRPIRHICPLEHGFCTG
jgi:hypothetical protein